MPIARMTTNGRITIPLEIRQSYGLAPGTRVEFVERDGKTFVLFPVPPSGADDEATPQAN